MLEAATTSIRSDEPAWALVEVNLRANPATEKEDSRRPLHRWQIITVRRGQSTATHWRDLGSVRKYRGVDQVRIYGFWAMTVGELMEEADKCREKKRLVPEEAYANRPNLVQGYWDAMDYTVNYLQKGRKSFRTGR